MSDHVKEITQQDYEREVAAAKGAVVLDFYSTECPPCGAAGERGLAAQQTFFGFVSIFMRCLSRRGAVTPSGGP